MFRAEQTRLFEETNQSIVNIRATEVKYFSKLHATIGSQATIIGGFVFSVMFDNFKTAYDTFPDKIVRMNRYGIASTICVAAALNIMICTTSTQVEFAHAVSLSF
jgi:hypothetical protein